MYNCFYWISWMYFLAKTVLKHYRQLHLYSNIFHINTKALHPVKKLNTGNVNIFCDGKCVGSMKLNK